MSNTEKKKLDRKTAKSVFLRLCTYVLKYWYLFIPAVLLTLFSNQLSLLGPKYSGEAIDALALSTGVDFKEIGRGVV